MADDPDFLDQFRDQVVVIDIEGDYLAFGTLAHFDRAHLRLADADLHDQREANSSKDVYALETRQIGVRANRRSVTIPRHRIIAISRLDDLVL